MKIKTKKQLNLPQLIEYIWDKDIKNECFRRLDRGPFEYVWVDEDSNIEFDDYILFRKNDIFEIEVEEEINECSNIKRLVHYTVHGFTSIIFNKSIGELRKSDSLAFYIMNDDRTLTLIWRDGKLVE